MKIVISHNPCFIRLCFAMKKGNSVNYVATESQSLFY